MSDDITDIRNRIMKPSTISMLMMTAVLGAGGGGGLVDFGGGKFRPVYPYTGPSVEHVEWKGRKKKTRRERKAGK